MGRPTTPTVRIDLRHIISMVMREAKERAKEELEKEERKRDEYIAGRMARQAQKRGE